MKTFKFAKLIRITNMAVVAALWLSIFALPGSANYEGELACDFGTGGTYIYDGSSWTSITSNIANEQMEAWAFKLVVDFGTSNGIYTFL